MITMFMIGIMAVAMFAIFTLWLRSSFEKMITQKFEQASAKAMRDNLDAVVTLAGKSFQDQTRILHDDLKGKEESFKTLVSDLREYVNHYQQEIKTTELDRVGKFSELSTLLSGQKEAVLHLTSSADKLNKVLNTNSLRGQYGQRIADDILRSSGLIEGLHYVQDQQQENSTTRPDFTFFLPDRHKVNMDVKFPANNLIRAHETQDEAEQKRCIKEFVNDVKKRMDEVAKKDYINTDENTVDYAILFVPSEGIYASIHSVCPEIFDLAEKKKIVLAAPFSLVAILKIILQSFRHFHFEQRTRELVNLIEKLGEDMARFSERFGEFGGQIKKLQKAYDEIAQTSFKKIDSKIRQIELYKLGSADSETQQAENPKVS